MVSWLTQHYIPLYFPFVGTFVLGIMCFMLPLATSLFIYNGKLAKLTLVSALVAGFYAFNFMIAPPITEVSLRQKCITSYHGKLIVSEGGASCLWNDDSNEGTFTDMGSVFGYSTVLMPIFAVTFIISLLNMPIAIFVLMTKNKNC